MSERCAEIETAAASFEDTADGRAALCAFFSELIGAEVELRDDEQELVLGLARVRKQ